MNDVIIPVPTYIVIDDVGWWSGTNGSQVGEPFRTGIDRAHCVADYEALDLFAAELNIKPQIALVIGEWDRYNILRNVPHSNWNLEEWDNSCNVGGHLDLAMEVINRGNMCIAIHGLCHEYWEEKRVLTRAEFGYDRSIDVLRQHLDAYFRIMHDNGYKGEVKTFVPPSFYHTAHSISKLLRKYGVQYISTVFDSMKYEGVADRYIFEDGIITCDRTTNVIAWNEINAMPPTEIKHGFFGLHWPNLLHQSTDRNSQCVQRWVEYFNKYKREFGIILAKNEQEAHVQTVYEKDGALTVTDEGVRLEMPEASVFTQKCYLHSKRALRLKPVRIINCFYEYLVPAADSSLIP